jgi:hypothetical protein
MDEAADREMALEILRLFERTHTDGWDLHVFFELVAGDNPSRREAILDVVDRLVRYGYLESRGSDFYTLTDQGMEAARRGEIDEW